MNSHFKHIINIRNNLCGNDNKCKVWTIRQFESCINASRQFVEHLLFIVE